MDLQQIEYFVRVAELGSFSKAANALNVSQPALSRQVHLLEQELKQPLLRRHGRGAEQTEAGKRFLAHAKALLHLAARAKEDLLSLAEAPSGRVALGLPPRVARVLTPYLVPLFRERFPEASIAIGEGLSAQLREWLVEGRIDLALLYDPSANPKLRYEPLCTEELLLVGAPRDGARLPAHIPISALRHYPLILPSVPHAIRMAVESACGAKKVRLEIVAEVDAVHTSLVLAAQGQGYAILPASTVARAAEREGLTAARVGTPPLAVRLVMGTPRNRPMTRLAEATRALVAGADWAKLFSARTGGASSGT